MNIAAVLSTIHALSQVAAMIPAAIDIAEKVIGPGKGAAKLEVAKGVILTAVQGEQTIVDQFGPMVPMIEGLIGHAVAAAKGAPNA